MSRFKGMEGPLLCREVVVALALDPLLHLGGHARSMSSLRRYLSSALRRRE